MDRVEFGGQLAELLRPHGLPALVAFRAQPAALGPVGCGHPLVELGDARVGSGADVDVTCESEPGVGPLTAAKLVGEIAGIGRFASDAKLARAAGVAPIPVSSGKTSRHRLDRSGNREINAAIHRVAVTRARCHPETRDYIARKTADGKTHREAIRCLKRHLTRHVWRLLQPPIPDRGRSIS